MILATFFHLATPRPNKDPKTWSNKLQAEAQPFTKFSRQTLHHYNLGFLAFEEIYYAKISFSYWYKKYLHGMFPGFIIIMIGRFGNPFLMKAVIFHMNPLVCHHHCSDWPFWLWIYFAWHLRQSCKGTKNPSMTHNGPNTRWLHHKPWSLLRVDHQ